MQKILAYLSSYNDIFFWFFAVYILKNIEHNRLIFDQFRLFEIGREIHIHGVFDWKAGKFIADEVFLITKIDAHSDFITDYNAFKGNAYGLANTLRQTAIFRPACQSKKVKNLFYTGQLTVPGPGVPPSLISGEVVAKQVIKVLK